jgi:FtsH-binding integral membrane protein
MSNYDRNAYASGAGVARAGAEIDQGLRSFMMGVYNHMVLGLALTGVVAVGIYMLSFTTDASQAAARLRDGAYLTSIGYALYASPLKWVVIFSPLAVVFYLGFRIERMSPAAALGWFLTYAGLVGLSLGAIFMIYKLGSIAQVFFITATAFGALSLYGYTTRRDLSGMGTFLFMGVIGLLLASIVNIFLGSSVMQFVISFIGVLVFAGLTAYDTQTIKTMYYEADDRALMAKKSVLGALKLYIDFIAMFQFMLSLLGNRE